MASGSGQALKAALTTPAADAPGPLAGVPWSPGGLTGAVSAQCVGGGTGSVRQVPPCPSLVGRTTVGNLLPRTAGLPVALAHSPRDWGRGSDVSPQCQNLHDSEHLTWLVVNHIQDLISLSHEPPVQDFISAVHRNSAASGLFLQAIQSRCENLSAVSPAACGQCQPPGRSQVTFSLPTSLSRQPTTLRKTLQCLEGIHLSQSGAVLTLYVDKLLCTPFRVLARMVDTLACRRVEMLLAANLQVLSPGMASLETQQAGQTVGGVFSTGTFSTWPDRSRGPCVSGCSRVSDTGTWVRLVPSPSLPLLRQMHRACPLVNMGTGSACSL